MSTYVYKSFNDKERPSTVIKGVTFTFGTSPTFNSDQLILNELVPEVLDRYVDGVKSNDDLLTPFTESAQDKFKRGLVTQYTAAQLSALAAAGGLTQHAAYVASDTGDEYVAISASALSPRVVVEATAYVTLTATGTAFTGPCELAGYYCSVAAGNITIYDNTSATGTPIVPTQALVAGPNPIFGAGTNGKLVLGTGCHVVLSGAATVRMLVQ